MEKEARSGFRDGEEASIAVLKRWGRRDRLESPLTPLKKGENCWLGCGGKLDRVLIPPSPPHFAPVWKGGKLESPLLPLEGGKLLVEMKRDRCLIPPNPPLKGGKIIGWDGARSVF